MYQQYILPPNQHSSGCQDNSYTMVSTKYGKIIVLTRYESNVISVLQMAGIYDYRISQPRTKECNQLKELEESGKTIRWWEQLTTIPRILQQLLRATGTIT